MLQVKEVSKKYADHQALSNVSLEVKKATIFGLLGPNGAGKTSLIRIINQIILPDSGSVFFGGEALKKKHIQQIGYLPEERGLYPKMGVAEQLLYLAQLKGIPKTEAKEHIKAWLHKFDFWDKRNKTIEELSKGMAQKVQFISAVVHKPKLLIFDEPFTGFDPTNTNLIKGEILKLKEEGATIIFSTHRMDSVEEICDDIALIHQSEKVLEGSTQAVRNKFKKGIYRFEISGDVNFDFGTEYQLIEKIQKADLTVLRIQCSIKKTSGLLALIGSKAHVISFNEEVPSLNDIFIQKVQGNG